MKVKVEAHVAPWSPPEKVHFDEGLKLPIACVDKEIVQMLCRKWLDAICQKSGMTFEIVFDVSDDKEQS